MPKCPFFRHVNSENMSNHSSTKSFEKLQDKLRPVGMMTFFFWSSSKNWTSVA